MTATRTAPHAATWVDRHTRRPPCAICHDTPAAADNMCAPCLAATLRDTRRRNRQLRQQTAVIRATAADTPHWRVQIAVNTAAARERRAVAAAEQLAVIAADLAAGHTTKGHRMTLAARLLGHVTELIAQRDSARRWAIHHEQRHHRLRAAIDRHQLQGGDVFGPNDRELWDTTTDTETAP